MISICVFEITYHYLFTFYVGFFQHFDPHFRGKIILIFGGETGKNEVNIEKAKNDTGKNL